MVIFVFLFVVGMFLLGIMEFDIFCWMLMVFMILIGFGVGFSFFFLLILLMYKLDL